MIKIYIKSILFAAALLVSVFAVADTMQGRIVSVADGDTVTVLDAANKQTKIRLMGIDAPEKAQAFGTRSKQTLSDLVFNKQVSVEYNKRDKYGRTIGKIIVNGLDANLEQVKAGMAWHYKQYAKEQTHSDRTAYAEAEIQARTDKRGLWVDSDLIPPWQWRRGQ